MRIRYAFPAFLVFLLVGCVTVSGNYVVSAENSDGSAVGSEFAITADGSGIYSARNVLCATYPGAIVHIKDAATGEELNGESPYKCR